VSSADVIDMIVGTLTGIVSSTAFVLALFLGFCIILGLPKLRQTAGRKSMVTKNLEETVGQEAYARYLPASAPRGPLDVLHQPEPQAPV
jgi:hypothetical protein